MSNKQQRSEQELILDMAEILQSKMEKDYEKGNTKRDAHPKTLGVMKAYFEVSSHVPDALKVGVFARPNTYKSWIRFSNAKGSIESDKKKDFRGIGIKLIGVDGERSSDFEQTTQDFLLMNNPTMPLGTVQLFHDAVYYSIVKSPVRLLGHLIFTGHGNILKELSKNKKNDTSPLDLNYYSTTPYRLGNTYAKYRLVPTSTTKSSLPKPLTDTYLTDNMSKHLSKDVATFDFMVQLYKNEKETPIEDAAVEWVNAPFIKLATIIIPQQTFDTKERLELGEQLSFSPDNALLVHEPVGGINRARKYIYARLSNFRHERDERIKYEPNEEDFDRL